MPGIPEHVGPYSIGEVLGEGAMGVVFLAEQREPVRRTVALKLLKRTTDSRQVLAGFEAERQALAVMDHPSIVKVFDAGVSEDQRPYVVMERVDGVPITEYCDEERLTIRERALLFEEVCRAIQHAHQKGVVHRDLKPSHILVSRLGERALPRIIDFGIAKAMGGVAFDGAPEDYEREVIGTPAYMSPEQIGASSDIDTRSDIYSLGIILYQLLVGTLPYEPDRRQGFAAVAAQLLREPPTLRSRLSSLSDTQDSVATLRRTTPPRLRRALRSDLEWIVARAIEKERSHRYQTADALAADLARYQADEPVQARRTSATYRFRKFVHRHKLGVSFAGAAAMGIVAFSVGTAIQAARVAQARDEAEGLIDFMLNDLRDKLEPLGRLDILVDVGERAVEYFRGIPAEDHTDPELSSRSQALTQLGRVLIDQGHVDEARQALDEALTLAAELSHRHPENDEWLMGLGYAEFAVGQMYWRQREPDSALVHFRAYQAIAQELARRDPSNVEYVLEVGYSHTNLGGVLRDLGNLEGALEQMRAALEVKERIAAAHPEIPARRYDVAQGHNALGVILRDLGRLPEARGHFEHEVAIKDSLVRADPDNAPYRFRLASGLHFLADALHDTGDVGGAAERLAAARVQLEALTREDPTNLRWLRNLAVAEHREGHVRLELGEVGRARSLGSAALARQEDLVQRDPDQPEWRADLGNLHRQYAQALLASGRLTEAWGHAQEAVTIDSALMTGRDGEGRDVIALGKDEILLGEIQLAQGSPEEARVWYTSAIGRLKPMVGQSADDELLVALARGLARSGRQDEAIELATRLEARGYDMPELTAIRALSGDDAGSGQEVRDFDRGAGNGQ
jgi:tetratricopeptide (TPR) repeat protein